MNIFDFPASLHPTPQPMGLPTIHFGQRAILEQALVAGAAARIAHEPHLAKEISEAIKTVLDTLYPAP